MPLFRFPLPPQCPGGGRHTFQLGFQVSACLPATTCRKGCCPVSQAGVPLIPVRHREGLSPVTWAQLPASAYQATEGT